MLLDWSNIVSRRIFSNYSFVKIIGQFFATSSFSDRFGKNETIENVYINADFMVDDNCRGLSLMKIAGKSFYGEFGTDGTIELAHINADFRPSCHSNPR